MQSQILQRYLGGLHHLSSSNLLLRFGHCCSPRVYSSQFEFHLNRPKSWASAPSNPLTRFKFCMHAACIHTDGTDACTLALSFFPALLCPLLLHTIIHFVMRRSYKPHRSNNTALSGMQAVPLFCKFCVHPWTLLHGLNLRFPAFLTLVDRL